jgi:hypothetical protein
MYPSKKDVVSAAIEACESFSECADWFFNFENSPSWLGWENWLTIDILRRLNSEHVRRFHPYSKQKLKLDLFVDAPIQIAVEIKTNYITDQEVIKPRRLMSERVVKDARKMRRLGGAIEKLLLVSNFFESNAALRAYPKRVKNDLAKRFSQFQIRWHNCSSGSGHSLLLVLSG